MTVPIIPSHFKLQYTQEMIAEAVSRMGAEMTAWANDIWKSSHTDVIAIPVLRGGIFFFADIVRQIRHSVEIAPVQTWSYTSVENAVPRDEVGVNIAGVAPRGRSILLVDDICDSGRTLKVLKETLLAAGAHEVRSAVLIKRVLDQETFDPEWVGFAYSGSEWFVGYGMEDCGRYRNLPDAYVIKQQ